MQLFSHVFWHFPHFYVSLPQKGEVMKKILIAFMLAISAEMSAQTVEDTNRNVQPKDSTLLERDALARDSLLPGYSSERILPNTPSDAATKLSVNPALYDNRRGSWEVNTMQGGVLFHPWRGAHVIASGGVNTMPGLLDRESGALTLYQTTGRWTFSASAMADKYRLVGMGFLQTRYGMGGTVGYRVNDAISLYAFGYYYGNSSMISPAVNPYLMTTNYGGYADFRISKNFGVDAGVRRYLNPMTGKWVTDPIVSPYIKFNNGQKLGFDFGHLLKGLFFGSEDNYMPRGPVRMAPPPQPIRR